ncbi:MAG: clan AA aspartic protease, partial [Marinilabiliaceae bacterium]|nr:clan AA aspartic protease [Marinilabiliaceae bacterium]
NYHVIIPFENVNDKIIIPVTIGNESYRFMLDTGAPCAISSNIAGKIGLKADTSVIIADQSKKEKLYSFGCINKIEIAGISFDSVPIIIGNEFGSAFSCLNIDGIIGSNLLRNSIVQFSYQKGQIILTDQFKKLNIDSINISPMILSEDQSIPFIQFIYSPSIKKFKKKMGSYAMFDSGSDDFISISFHNLEYSDSVGLAPKVLAESFGSNTFGLHGAAKNSISYLLDLPIFSIGHSVFLNGTASTTIGNSSVIGTQLLKYGTVTIDYINKQFCFKPKTAEESVIDVIRKRFPIDPGFNGDTLVVGQIWDDKLLKEIEVGDRILSINDINTENITPCDMISGNTFKNIEELTLRIETKNKGVISFTLEKTYFKEQLKRYKKNQTIDWYNVYGVRSF